MCLDFVDSTGEMRRYEGAAAHTLSHTHTLLCHAGSEEVWKGGAAVAATQNVLLPFCMRLWWSEERASSV